MTNDNNQISVHQLVTLQNYRAIVSVRLQILGRGGGEEVKRCHSEGMFLRAWHYKM